LEVQTTVTNQSNTEQKEQCWRYHNTWLQTILQSHSNKNSMVLAQKRTWRPVEQNRGPGYESTQLCLLNFWHKFLNDVISIISSKFILDFNLRFTLISNLFNTYHAYNSVYEINIFI
jgi:hypothetical protein